MCVADFDFFAITQQFGLTYPIEGILGLSQNNQFMHNVNVVDLTVGPLIVNYLQTTGDIARNEFSFYMTMKGKSFVDIGEANP